MTPDFGEVAAGKPYRRGCLQIVGQPRPVVRGDCDFSFGSSLFVLGRIAGIRAAPPPPWGRRRARISVAGARLRFAEPSQSGRRFRCKKSCPNASPQFDSDDVSGRRFDMLCDAGRQAPLRDGVPLAEVRTVPPPMDAVVFGASVKILRGIWDRNILSGGD